MKRRMPATVASVALTASLLGASVASAQDLGYDGSLTAGIPEPDADFQAQEAIHEGGLHFSYVTSGDPEALPWIFQYRAALQAAGWTIVDMGGGGNPFGSPGGANLIAEHPDGRYLTLNAGHPGVQHLDHAPSVSTFIDGCVWPAAPADDTCQPLRVIDTDDGVAANEADVGAVGDLTVGIPEPSDSEYQGDDAIAEGGRHFYYISSAGHFDVFHQFLTALHMGGWTISDVVTNGDEAVGGGTGIATDGSRYLKFSAGGSGVVAHFDACVWPQQPSEDDCPQGSNH